ncbi:uncharacterized protein (TIGR01244 family) [Lysobacter niastensis]|uniref:Uncharacterized protein (TIGR01244 family) n=1 Tax=Lysobacter niastensis TaxID=380629 RepID=A0ABU1W849_9GAMM|nr:protein tyrosine phosphatase family protein [Lysobacter niastensis]MDR7133629.1 uncharacterized protein (TIGR01244 family) [Lysobacter niastensis]
MRLWRAIAAIAVTCAMTSVLAAPPIATVSDTSMQTSVPNLREPNDRLLTGGQPDAAAWKHLAADGVTTVINLRPDDEMAGRDEAAEVVAAGLSYRQIPVAGAAGITTENATALWTALAQAPGKVLVHCASGNRVGALLALGAVEQGGMDSEQALQFGKAAGLTGAEPRVREILGLPPAD